MGANNSVPRENAQNTILQDGLEDLWNHDQRGHELRKVRHKLKAH